MEYSSHPFAAYKNIYFGGRGQLFGMQRCFVAGIVRKYQNHRRLLFR